jgi:hypothetical protein
MTDLSRLAIDVAFDVRELAEPVARFAGDLGLGRRSKVVEVTPQVSPAGSFAQMRYTIGIKLVKRSIALVAIRLKDAAGIGQIGHDMLFLPVRCEPIDRSRRG